MYDGDEIFLLCIAAGTRTSIMIADGLNRLLNLPDLGWATADAPKQFKKKGTEIKGKKHTAAKLQGKNNGSLPSVDMSLLMDETSSYTVCGISGKCK